MPTFCLLKERRGRMNIPTLATSRLIIRPISVLDADDMFEYAKTPYVGPQAGWEPHHSIEYTIAVIKNMQMIKSQYELGNWAIVERSTGKMIGTIELYNHIPLFKAELGYALNPQYWGQGIIPEAAFEVITFGFEYLHLKRIEAGVFTDNLQSQRVCEKLGFTKEGIARNGYLRYDGKIFDKIQYGLTNSEFFEKFRK